MGLLLREQQRGVLLRFGGVSLMASSSSIGPSDIAKLLDLLNASEPHDENGEGPVSPDANTPPPDVDPGITQASHSVDPSDFSKDFAENRFAAHIISGMRKLKRAT
jgi:hypothetical protein